MPGYACGPDVISQSAPTFHSQKCPPRGDKCYVRLVLRLLRAGMMAERQRAFVERNRLGFSTVLSVDLLCLECLAEPF